MDSGKDEFAWSDENKKLLFEWWQELENDKGSRARLRRCQNLAEVCFEPAYVYLCRELGVNKYYDKEKIAALAGLLSHVKTNIQENIAKQMSSSKNGGNQIVSEARFRRLIAAEKLEEAYHLMRRLIALLDHSVNIDDLCGKVWYWGTDKTKRELVYDYYANI